MIYLQRATGCEEKRKEGGREARNETRRLSKFGMIGSAASRDNLSMKRRILGFSFLFVIPFFYRSLFFFFFVFLRNLQTLLVLLLLDLIYALPVILISRTIELCEEWRGILNRHVSMSRIVFDSKDRRFIVIFFIKRKKKRKKERKVEFDQFLSFDFVHSRVILRVKFFSQRKKKKNGRESLQFSSVSNDDGR